MAVVRNLMVRIGADFSEMSKGMQGATNRLNRFSRDTRRATNEIRGRNGIGGITTEFKQLGRSVTDTLNNIRGAKGIGGLTRSLGGLKPALAAATVGLTGLRGAAGGAGLVIGTLIAILAALAASLYSVSQRAVRFEADLGRLNMQLRGGSRDFMEWARSLGLARESAAQMGATYGTLLSSFLSDQEDLTNATKQLVQATRVTASATGRSIQDVMERMRSGLLGNTEAIEDLGIFVNVSMIESTKAFRRFAGDKSWEQLDFKMQQQIRLAAILEQTYDRYGDQLQDNVMTKQELLMEQLKDIQLNLSQAFLPIWDAVLPALTELASAVANVTENIARFSYWLRGWDYDERTSGMNDYNDSVVETGDSLDEMGDKAKKARSELAAFDRLNLLGFNTGTGTGGGSGGSGGDFLSPIGGVPQEGKGLFDWLDKIPRLIKTKFKIEFDMPRFPDLGAVATAITSTVNQMIAQLRASYTSLWERLGIQTQAGLAGQLAQWRQFAANLSGVTLPTLVANVTLNWSSMWESMRSTTAVNVPSIQALWQSMLDGLQQRLAVKVPTIQLSWQTMLDNLRQQLGVTSPEIQLNWQTMLDSMRDRLAITVPPIQVGWQSIVTAVHSVLNPLAEASNAWNGTLSGMLGTMGVTVPVIQFNWDAIGVSIRSLLNPLAEIKTAWSNTLQSLKTDAINHISSILGKISELLNAWSSLQRAFGQEPNTEAQSRAGVDWSKVWDTYGEMFSVERMKDIANLISDEAAKPENQAGLAAMGLFTGGGKLVGQLGRLGNISNWFKNIGNALGNAIPAFASGGIVSGPTLAMVGEYAGAVNNPEVIAPLSDLETMMSDGEQTAIMRQMLHAIREGQNITVTISEGEIASAAVRGINNQTRRTGKNPLIL